MGKGGKDRPDELPVGMCSRATQPEWNNCANMKELWLLWYYPRKALSVRLQGFLAIALGWVQDNCTRKIPVYPGNQQW